MAIPLRLTITGTRNSATETLKTVLSAWPCAVVDLVVSDSLTSRDGALDDPMTVRMTLDGFISGEDGYLTQDIKPKLRESGLPAKEDEIPY